ncbi:uncharacterized protein H6S33_011580 [Morchella sextelata]|uniref:uncharacterized protein n=1 Tax=Morchella sextelata TaxID=1174677 RepID=UPI001D05BA76|nr:uncharacterized protein H6S33_011580 [Morchella sextelata]KAH0611153.1 hypothetical protein H6S33_011580 [Morchella sextelata]
MSENELLLDSLALYYDPLIHYSQPASRWPGSVELGWFGILGKPSKMEIDTAFFLPWIRVLLPYFTRSATPPVFLCQSPFAAKKQKNADYSNGT